jgi:iron complex outermembrane recepter protein
VLGTFGTLPTSFGPDTAVNYEIGIKTDIIEDILRVDAAVFRIDWEDIQLLTSDGIVNGNINGGSAQSQGVEWTATFTPTAGLTVLWAGAYTDAELTSNTDPPLPAPQVTGGLSGDPLPNAPEWTSSFDVDYEWPVFSNAQAFVGGTWRYIGERYSGFSLAVASVTGDTQVELPAYSVFDLRAGVDFEHFAVELFAKNVSNELEPVTFGGFGSLPPGAPNGEASVLRPRTVGVSLTARF